MNTALNQTTRVIVDVFREQARSYRGRGFNEFHRPSRQIAHQSGRRGFFLRVWNKEHTD